MALLHERFDQYSSFYLYGATPAAAGTIELLTRMEKSVVGFIDKDPNKQSALHMGYPVFSPQVLVSDDCNNAGIIIVSAYQIEIADFLRRSGVDGVRVFPHLDAMFFSTYADGYAQDATLDAVSAMLNDTDERHYLSSWRKFKQNGDLLDLKPMPTMQNQYEHAIWWGSIKNKGLCCDVGAYDGQSSIEFAETGCFTKIVALEPFRENFHLLKSAIEKRNYGELIEPIQIAVGRSRETIWQDTESASSRSRLIKEPFISDGDQEKIEVYPLDDLDMKGLTMLKVDIEGFELSFLEGAINTIHKYRPHIAISAYHERSHCRRIFKFFQDNFVGWRINIGHHPLAVYELEYYISFDEIEAS